MPKHQKLTQQQINDLINRCISEDQKAFTKTLKEMEKAVGGKYFVLAKEGYEIFSKCYEVFNNNQDNSIIQCNALRLAKYTMDIPETLQKIYKEAWDLYQKTIFHTDGRIRVAGVRLLDRYCMGFQCLLCKQKNIKIGCTIDAYSDNPKYLCEKCAITEYMEEEGYSSYKIAEARRRRMFDVPYLFNELFTDAYIEHFGHSDIYDLDELDFNKIMEACHNIYNHLYNKEDKTRLEETESQEKIEEEFSFLLANIDMKKLFSDEL